MIWRCFCGVLVLSLYLGASQTTHFFRAKTSLFTPIRPLRAVLMNSQGPQAIFQVFLILEAKDLKSTQTIHRRLPILYDRLYRDFWGRAQVLFEAKKSLPAYFLSFQRRFLTLCREVLGRGHVIDVWIEDVQFKRLV